MSEQKAPYATAQPVTAVFSVIAWSEPFTAGKSSTIIVRRRESDLFRVTFQNQAAREAFPDLMRAAIAERGGEMVLCEELPARYK